MNDFKIVYLIVERGMEPNRQTFWKSAGNAYVCRDGSLNLKLDIHPGLTFNIRDPRSNGERNEAAAETEQERTVVCEECERPFRPVNGGAFCPDCIRQQFIEQDETIQEDDSSFNRRRQ